MGVDADHAERRFRLVCYGPERKLLPGNASPVLQRESGRSGTSEFVNAQINLHRGSAGAVLDSRIAIQILALQTKGSVVAGSP
jgi:hypothetical protein